MQKKNKALVWAGRILVLVVLFFVLKYAFSIYKRHDFNGFVKAEQLQYHSEFVRDKKTQYGKSDSYCISSEDFNDAMLAKKLEVTPRTPYKVTCMVKTENVIPEKEPSESGAQICISDTTEKSRSIVGTSDWQLLTFEFDSENRTEVEIGFRLGGYTDNCKGKVWFSDFKVEAGKRDGNTQWNIGCFIFENIDANIEINGSSKEVKIGMSQNDIDNVKQNMQRFATSMKQLSANQISIKYHIYDVTAPIQSLSFDSQNGYYLDAADVQKLIDPTIKENQFDHIFAVVKFGDSYSSESIPVNDWIGLGGTEYYGIGFSNIRLPSNEENYINKYDSRINVFPEEVYVHEFLHSLERNLKEYGYIFPELHDNETYGYTNQPLIGLRDWYQDYMRCNVIDKAQNTRVGLDPIVYTLKPVNDSNFLYPVEIEFSREPKNIIEEIRGIFKNISAIFNRIKIEENGEEQQQSESIGF